MTVTTTLTTQSDMALARTPNAVYPSDEVCAIPDCTTVLSVYNPTLWCALHEGKALVDLEERGVRSRGLRRRVR